jgi:hypothetical protein
MSSVADPQPEMPAEDELVAYLDGELPPEDCRRVAARLAADAGYRQRLHDLDRAWEALDALPSPRAGDDFARTTMELVTVAAQSDLTQQAADITKRARQRKWLLAAGSIAAILLGLMATRAAQSRGDRALLADLPVIGQLDVLTHVENIEFVRQLPSALPVDRLLADEAAVRDELLSVEWLSAPLAEDRQEWVNSLSAEEKSELAAHARRFRELPRRERDQLRDLQRAIKDADDAEQLQLNLLAYRRWLEQLTPGEQEDLREELKGVPLSEQMNRLERFARKEDLQAARQLSANEKERLREAVLAFVEERRAMLMDEMERRGSGQRARRLEGPRGALAILTWMMRNEEGAKLARERIVGVLDPETITLFDRLNPQARRMQLWQWIRQAMQPKLTPDELEEFFVDELDSNQRERLLNLPPGEMQSELEQMYLASELGFRGMAMPESGPWNAPRGPDFGPGMRRHPGGPPPDFRDRGPFDGPPDRRDGRRRGPPERPGPPPPHPEPREAI